MITTACLVNNLSYINLIIPTICNTKANGDLQRDDKELKLISTDLTSIWLLKDSHSRLDRTKRLERNDSLYSLQVGLPLIDKSYLEWKMTSNFS